VKINQPSGTVGFKHFTHPFHRHPVEGYIINVKAVYADIFCQPGQAFNIVIVPARHAAIDNGRILELGNKPAGDIAGVKMLLQPGIAATLTSGKDLLIEALQGEELARPVGEFPNGVINFDLQTLAVSFVKISFHLLRAKERIVDKRINFGRMVDIDDIGAGSGNL
jgi:hypothetical protein